MEPLIVALKKLNLSEKEAQVFLALLELVKQGAVDVAQHETFADIRITNTSTAAPKYG